MSTLALSPSYFAVVGTVYDGTGTVAVQTAQQRDAELIAEGLQYGDGFARVLMDLPPPPAKAMPYYPPVQEPDYERDGWALGI